MPTTKVKTFVSYSQQDIHHLEELWGFLQGLENEGVEFWTGIQERWL